MNDYLLNKLFSLRRFGIQPGLERIQYILDNINNPQRKYYTTHIAGTNGKGSVASVLASILKESGHRVGLYTSPHIFSFNERIKVNGEEIKDVELEPLVAKLLDIGEKVNATFFEITTAIAFEYFAQKGVDIAVIETGLGGRFDATNVVSPLFSVITKIDLDHTEHLGNTLEAITLEKAGIAKPKRPLVVGKNSKEVYSILVKLLYSKTDILLAEFLAKPSQTEYIDSRGGKLMQFNIVTPRRNYFQLTTPLLGSYQVENISTALAAVETIEIPFGITDEHIYVGLKNIRQNTGLHGRLEIIRFEPPIVIDVAHNPNAVTTTISELSHIFPSLKWNIIFAAMKDKDIKGMLAPLIPAAKRIILPNLSFERAENNQKIQDMLEASNRLSPNGIDVPEAHLYETPTQALNFALKCNEPLLVIGSFYLLGELASDLNRQIGWKFNIANSRLVI
jgi:dihydrofolate synthase/folylpolyglutamate synthase